MSNNSVINKSSELGNNQTSQGTEIQNVSGFGNFSQPPPVNMPMNYPPMLPNQCIPPYSFMPPPPFYAVPPPFPHMSRNLPFNYSPPVNFLPPGYNPSAQPFVAPNMTVTKNELSSTSSMSSEEVLFPDATKKPNVTSNIKLWEVSRYFRTFHSLLKEFESELKSLVDDDVEINSNQWHQRYQRIISKREKLISYKNSMTMDSTFLCCLKYKINRRKKKRTYRKRIEKSHHSIPVYEIANMHVQQLQQDANLVKQEEKLKQEADNILSSVIQKKSDARYQIQLITNLLKLYSARVHKLSVETKLTVDSTITGFEKILEKLKNLWESNLREYITEENGLKLMIKELAVNAEDEDCLKLKKNFEKWLELIFGNSNLQAYQFYTDCDQLIEIRQEWDKFIVDKEDSIGSKIPAGWVVPKYNDNPEWKKFLSQ